MSSIFSKHNGMKLEMNYPMKTGKFTSVWRLKNILLNDKWIDKERRREIKKNTLREIKVEKLHKIYGCSKNNSMRGVHSELPTPRNKKSLK